MARSDALAREFRGCPRSPFSAIASVWLTVIALTVRSSGSRTALKSVAPPGRGRFQMRNGLRLSIFVVVRNQFQCYFPQPNRTRGPGGVQPPATARFSEMDAACLRGGDAVKKYILVAVLMSASAWVGP